MAKKNHNSFIDIETQPEKKRPAAQPSRQVDTQTHREGEDTASETPKISVRPSAARNVRADRGQQTPREATAAQQRQPRKARPIAPPEEDFSGAEMEALYAQPEKLPGSDARQRAYAEFDEELAPDERPMKKKKKERSQNATAATRGTFRTFLWRCARPLLMVAIALVVVAAGVGLGLRYAYGHYFAPVDPDSTQMVEVTIKKGARLSEISDMLEEQGIVRSGKIFKYYVDFSDMSAKLVAGTFELSPSMNFDEIINVLKKPTSVTDTTWITFREGISTEDVGKLLVSNGVLKNDTEFGRIARTGEGLEDYEFIAEVIAKNETSSEKRKNVLEGYLSPNTYNLYTNSSELTALQVLITQFDKVFTDEYKARAEELGMSIDEVVTLASMIEKEAKTDDFKKVSAVFHNRLKADMPLGSDTTIAYYLGTRKMVYTSAELQTQTGYNTHINKGLPLGPICNPGEKAIEAALYPDEEYVKGGYYYFCVGDPETGEIIFSKTAEEHAAAQAKWADVWRKYDEEHKS